MKIFVLATALVIGHSLSLQAPSLNTEYGQAQVVQGNAMTQNLMGGANTVGFNLQLQGNNVTQQQNRIGSQLPQVNVPTQQTITTTYNRVISIPEY